MIRLYLLTRELARACDLEAGDSRVGLTIRTESSCTPARTGRMSAGRPRADRRPIRRAWNANRSGLIALRPIAVSIEGTGALQLAWLDAAGKAGRAAAATALSRTTSVTAPVAANSRDWNCARPVVRLW